jgi:hypothetical protein
MRIDVIGRDGVIEATANIPDSLWSSDVQAAANLAAAAHGQEILTSPLDDHIDPHTQMILTSAGLIQWINSRGTASSPGPTAPAVPVASPGVGTAITTFVGAAIAGGILWAAFRTVLPAPLAR